MIADSDSYFASEIENDRREILAIDDLLDRVWKTLADSNMASGWPYRIRDRDKVTAEGYESASTRAMVLYALGLPLRYSTFDRVGPEVSKEVRNLFPNLDKLKSCSGKTVHQQLKDVVSANFDKLVEDLTSGEKDKGEALLDNSSFGKKNPFTLTWLLSATIGIVLRPEDFGKDISKGPYKKKLELFLDRLHAWTQIASSRLSEFSTGTGTFLDVETKEGDAAKHSFPALRTLHLLRVAQEVNEKDNLELVKPLKKFKAFHDTWKKSIRELRSWFESRLLDHLAYSDLRDAPFDAAELAFSLEGYLICARGASRDVYDINLVRKVFDVLANRQLSTPYWRPLKPLLTTKKGFALLPLSVEIVNSLFRSCKMLDVKGDKLFVDHISIFRRYFEWLESRATSGSFEVVNPKHGEDRHREFFGWHSEHVQDTGLIHVWETSQVAIYLTNYREMLQKRLAQRSLEAARLRAKVVPRSSSEGSSTSRQDYWDSEVAIKSPNSKENSAFDTIKKHFIMAREPGAKGHVSFSAVLFGPPGTGKTGIAEDIAATLKWPLITITPSDFVAHGESSIEQRAREIFIALEEQQEAVILLDEIDRLVLDRNSPMYDSQSDMFQVLTPGMLPKLKDLRSRERCIFLLATNYVERIDPAAIRIGRFDEQILISLPNSEARKQILVGQLRKALNRAGISLEKKNGTEIPPLTPNDADSFSSRTALAAFSELRQLAVGTVAQISESLAPGGTQTSPQQVSSALEEKLLEFAPAVRIDTYKTRFILEERKESENEKLGREPDLEFIDVAGLVSETDGTTNELRSDTEATKAVKSIMKRICDLGSSESKSSGLAPAIRRLTDQPRFRPYKSSLETIAKFCENET